MSDQTLKTIQVVFRVMAGLVFLSLVAWLVLTERANLETLLRVVMTLLGMDFLASGVINTIGLRRNGH